jgi:GLPGLI family protein
MVLPLPIYYIIDMKIKNIICFFLVFTFFSTKAQKNNNGKITYKVEFVGNQKRIDSLSKIKPNSTVVKILKSQKTKFFELIFSGNLSLSQINNTMRSDAFKGVDMVEVYIGKDAKFYTNKKEKNVLTEKESMGTSFLLQQPFLKWKLINSTKNIGKYTTYKATTEKEIVTRNGTIIRREVVAWYCPELPIGFGPKEFSGLPGLILELKDGALNFIVEKIELNLKGKIKVSVPKKSKIILLDEYNNLLKKKAIYYKKKIK